MDRSFRSFLLAATLTAATCASAQPLNGTYTVGTAGTYTTLAAAITALQTNGVSGPVNMDILSGTYTGNWTINAIAGTSAVNTVTFRSQALLNTAVVLTFTNAGSPVVTYNGCAFVTFRHVTITGSLAGVRYSTNPADCAVRDCIVSVSSAFGAAIASSTSQADRARVENNTITSPFLGINFSSPVGQWDDDLVLRGNTIATTAQTAIVSQNGDNITIEGNTINSTGSTTGTYINGIDVRDGRGSIIIRSNTVVWGMGSWALYMDDCIGDPGTPPLVENNMLVKTGGSLTGSAVNIIGTSNVVFRYNSVRCTVVSHAVQFQFSSANTVEGNIMATTSEEVLMTQSATFASIDHNVYYCTQPNVIRWAVFTFYNWATWQGLGWDANSVFADPLFTAATDLHILAGSPAIGLGPMPLQVSADRDGDARGTINTLLPDAGADERTDACALGLSGTYLLGPSGAGIFPSFTSAVAAMASCGISGPVVFEVESGVYNEQISIPTITGTSATNTITFRSQAMDSSAVLLRWPSATANNWVVRFNGADHVTLDRITVERTGGPSFATVVYFQPPGLLNDSRSITISHCRLMADGSSLATSAVLDKAAMTTVGNDSLKVEHTRFIGGGSGIYANIGLNDKLLVQDNYFVGQNASAMVIPVASASFTIRRNGAAHAPFAYNHAVMISNASAGFTIEANRFSNTNGTAIGLSSTNTSLGGTSIVRNNMLRGSTYGLWTIGSTSGLRVDHNSMYGGVSGLYFFSSGPVNIASLRNNVLQGGLYGLQRDAAVSVSFAQTSHNALFSPTGDVANSGGTLVGTIAALQALTGQFASSIEVDPKYFDQATCDLHAYVMELDGAGTPLLAVTSDFDGQVRSTTTPDIGADEFTPQLWNDAFNTCSLADVIVSTGSGTDQWIYKDRKVVARLNDNGRVLGNVGLSFYVNSGPVRTSDMGQRYLDRNWRLATQNSLTGSILLRVFFSGNEFTAYAAADPLVTTQADAGLTHYIGVNENCSETDNPIGQTWLSYYPVLNGSEPRINAAGGTSWATAVLAQDGEIYMSGLGQVLPVELLSFSGERTNERLVQLKWTTATEHNNEGFEVWRMIEGEDGFTNVAWVDGAGESQTLVNYALPDDNATSRMSYYQLKQVDHDGQFEWSPVVAVSGSGVDVQLAAYPNPARDRVVLSGLPASVVRITMIDAAGRIVRAWGNTRELDGLDGSERGVYTIVAESSEEVKTMRLVLE